MKRLLIGAVCFFVFAPLAYAQRGGGARGGGIGNAGWGGGRGGFGRFDGNRFDGNRFGRSNFNNGGFGWLGYGGWGYPFVDDYDSQPSQPTVIVPVTIQFVGPPPPPPPPPEPPRLAVRSYVWPDTATPTEAINTFAIVSKDGSMRSAIAVWVQGTELRYRTEEGGGRVPLAQIDREKTLRVNAERGLRFWLP